MFQNHIKCVNDARHKAQQSEQDIEPEVSFQTDFEEHTQRRKDDKNIKGRRDYFLTNLKNIKGRRDYFLTNLNWLFFNPSVPFC